MFYPGFFLRESDWKLRGSEPCSPQYQDHELRGGELDSRGSGAPPGTPLDKTLADRLKKKLGTTNLEYSIQSPRGRACDARRPLSVRPSVRPRSDLQSQTDESPIHPLRSQSSLVRLVERQGLRSEIHLCQSRLLSELQHEHHLSLPSVNHPHRFVLCRRSSHIVATMVQSLARSRSTCCRPRPYGSLFSPSPSSSHCFLVEPVSVCYYTNWAQYRNGPGRSYPENIDVNLCTHVIYSFGQLTNGVLAAYEWNDESTLWSTGMYARMMNIRKGSKPKILLAVGGWNHGSGKFSDMVGNATQRATFITTTIIFLQKHKFDGLDLDWVRRTSVRIEGDSFLSLCRNIQDRGKVLDRRIRRTSRSYWSN